MKRVALVAVMAVALIAAPASALARHHHPCGPAPYAVAPIGPEVLLGGVYPLPPLVPPHK